VAGVVHPPGGDTSLPPTGQSGDDGSTGRQSGRDDSSVAGTGRDGSGDRGDRRSGSSSSDSSAGRRRDDRASSSQRDRPSQSSAQTPDSEQTPVKPDPAKEASDWRWLIILLIVLGVVGIGGLLFWQRGVRPVVEKKKIREALPPELPPEIAREADPRRFIVALYHKMAEGLGKIGLIRRPPDTPVEYAQTVTKRDPGLEQPVSSMTDLFHVARYSECAITAADAARARAAWHQLASSVKHVDLEAIAEAEAEVKKAG
jgi:hypothetical protein